MQFSLLRSPGRLSTSLFITMVKSTSILQLASSLLALGFVNPKFIQIQSQRVLLVLADGAEQVESLDVGLPVLDRQLLEVVRQGDVQQVEWLLSRGASVNAGNRYLGYPVAIATEQGNQAMVQLLIAQGANVDVVSAGGQTALGRAVDMGNLELVRILIEAGASPDRRTTYGVPLLYRATEMGNVEMVRLLLRGRVNTNAQVAGITPLHKAVETGNVAITRLLLEGNADPDIAMPLYRAVEVGNSELVKLLLRYGANPRISERGVSALSLAQTQGNSTVANMLRQAM